MKSKDFAGSNTHIFAMIYPLVVLMAAILLDTIKEVGILSIPEKYFIGVAGIPVIISIAWFLIKNKGLHRS